MYFRVCQHELALFKLGVDWKIEWFYKSPGYWKSHQREFLETVAAKLGIKNPEDWGFQLVQFLIHLRSSYQV